MSDIVNHPAHYEACRVVIEPIDVCEAYDFCTGNAIKYMCRAGKKDGASEATDLKKARWYLERAMSRQGLLSCGRLTLPRDTPDGMRVCGATLLLASQVPLVAVLTQRGLKAAVEALSERIKDLEGDAA